SLFRESPFGESVRRCGKRHIAAPKGSRGPPPHSPQLHRSGPRRGRSVGSLQAYSPFGEFVNLRALATVAGRLTCDIDWAVACDCMVTAKEEREKNSFRGISPTPRLRLRRAQDINREIVLKRPFFVV